MATNPNITVLDKDGNPIEDRQIEVNGILPGSGSGGESYWLLDNGTLVPEGDASEVDLSNVTAKVAAPSASDHAARKQDVDSLSASDVSAIPTDEKGAASGVATLDSAGDLDTGQVPSIAVTDVYVVDYESDLTSLDATQGDVGIASQEEGSWILATDDPTQSGNWKQLNRAEPPVTSVFGRTGDITAQSGDYSLGQIGDVDVNQLLEGTIANRPAAGTAGRWYHATDQSIMYRDDGSSWTAIAGTGQAGERVPNTSYFDGVDANDVTASSVSTGDLLANNVVIDQSTVGSLSYHSGANITVSGGSWHTIFSNGDAVDVIGGTVAGLNPDKLRVTWADGTTDSIYTQANKRAPDGAGDSITVVHVPSIRQITTLEFLNDASDGDYGYSVISIS